MITTAGLSMDPNGKNCDVERTELTADETGALNWLQ